MTKVSDYLNERWNDPDRKEDRIAIVMIGAIAVIVIVILLFILWRHIAGANGQKEQEILQEQAFQDEQEMTTAVYEEEAAKYLSPNEERDELGEEYLANIEYLNSQLEELLQAMTLVEQNLSETVSRYQEEDAQLREQIESLHTEVTVIVENLKETQTKLYDLTDIVQIMDQEKIPMIQEQIVEIRGDMEQVHVDITNLYTKIAALEQEDVKLWAGIDTVEKTLKTALDQNMTEVNNQFDVLLGQLTTVENRIGRLAVQTLRYRYDEGENTLYLEPYEE